MERLTRDTEQDTKPTEEEQQQQQQVEEEENKPRESPGPNTVGKWIVKTEHLAPSGLRGLQRPPAFLSLAEGARLAGASEERVVLGRVPGRHEWSESSWGEEASSAEGREEGRCRDGEGLLLLLGQSYTRSHDAESVF